MNFGQDDQDMMLEILLNGWKRKDQLETKKKLVNSILPFHKYKLLQRILATQDLITTMKCLPIFLDERTRFFRLGKMTANQEFIRIVLKTITRQCPNIKILDLRCLSIRLWNMDNVKTFLQQTRSLQALRVRVSPRLPCAMAQLLLRVEFDQVNQDVRNGLCKIEYIEGGDLTPADCARLLKRLPNLKGFGIEQLLPLFAGYSKNENALKKFINFTEFAHLYTNFTSLEILVKFCPNARKIRIYEPKRNVVNNLWKFPLLTDLELKSEESDEFVTDLYTLLKRIGRQIEFLTLRYPNEGHLDSKILHELCPELFELRILSSHDDLLFD